jgi:hypothetical protein
MAYETAGKPKLTGCPPLGHPMGLASILGPPRETIALLGVASARKLCILGE